MKGRKFEVAVYDGHMINRLKAFTDAIMSIAATLLILSIPLPTSSQLSAYTVMITPVIVFIVSFLVIMSFYFSTIRVFARIHKLSGWQVFDYSLFLMLISLFPLLTKLNTGSGAHNIWLLYIYVLYIFLITRSHDYMMKWWLKYNEESVENQDFLRWSGYIATALCFILFFFKQEELGSLVIIWFPVRSLMKSVVIK